MLGWSFYAIDWILRLVMIPVVAHRRKRPLEAIAWLAAIFFIPVVGTILYFWLGEYTFRRSAKRHRKARKLLEALKPGVPQHPHLTRPLAEGALEPLPEVTTRVLDQRLGGLPFLGGNAVELLEQNDVIDRLIADMDAAHTHLHLLFYMYEDDDTGWRVARALAAAAQRGVRCRLLADAWASRAMFRTIKPFLEKHGVEVHGLLKVHPLRRPFARMDVRNHRKLAVIDGRVGYSGSTNIHDLDMDLDHGVWYQITARVEGPAVLQLQLVFLEDWYMSTDQMLDEPGLLPEQQEPGDVPVQVFPSGPAYPADGVQHLFTEALNEARERVIVTTPYFVPDDPTLLALRLAALRGAEVDLVVPESSDSHLADAAGRSFFDRLMDTGVRVYRHPSGILHAKTITVDDAIALIGTANFDRRSMFLNYEVTLVIHDARITADLRNRQQNYILRAQRLDHEQWCNRSTWEQVRDDTAALLSPVL